MRQITRESIAAFNTNSNFKKGNTQVIVEEFEGKSRTFLKLHGNTIAYRDIFGNLYITDAGWQSNTTKERLNGLNGVSIYQKDWTWYLNDKKWDGTMTRIIW